MTGGIIILQQCTKNHDRMLQQVTDVIIFHFGPFFALLPPYLTAQKIEILTKLKKTPEISSFYTGLSKIMITCYTVPEIWYVTDIIVIFHFGLFFAILQAKNVRFLRYDAQWTDGQMSGWTDGQMQKSDIQRSVPHLKIKN